jgi:CsoR family transcriptional regulator, copper-sensing transcriptional repressor
MVTLVYPLGEGIIIKNMQQEKKKQILKRMSYLSGHLEGVKKMIEKDEYCINIIEQNKGVISALYKVNEMILENHLNTCVVEAVGGGNKKEREEKIEEILKLFKNSK